MSQNRRSFLVALGAGAAALAAGGHTAAAERPPVERKKIKRVGIQLYTLRRQAAADLPGTLAALAKIGYKEIELAGYYDHSAADVRDLLKKNGLTAPSAHIPIEQIESAPDKTFADAKTIGQQWITVPSLPRGLQDTADGWKRVAAQFNAAGKQSKAAGFRFAFHNHNDIVRKTGDVLPIEILMKETDPALVSYEMDIFWAVNGGADPLALLQRYPGRFKMLHVKDGKGPTYDTQTDVGQGSIDFKTIFARAKGIEHYFVESDTAADPLAFAAASYRYLANLDF
ncbi:MAG: Xylose isomerase protein barrel [Gemmatimonadetes bacterium]|nr:Xylose isomerase protein barrel [Gemmatimonadota bacterium]